jgi:putative endonuclease
MKQPCVYILSNQARGTLYILVYYELFEDMLSAINREKQLKKWNRAWKIALIESSNNNWCDLYPDLAGS